MVFVFFFYFFYYQLISDMLLAGVLCVIRSPEYSEVASVDNLLSSRLSLGSPVSVLYNWRVPFGAEKSVDRKARQVCDDDMVHCCH